MNEVYVFRMYITIKWFRLEINAQKTGHMWQEARDWVN